MLDFPLRFLFTDKFPHIKIVEEMGSHLSEIVQKIIVKISRAGLPQRGFKLLDCVLSCFAVDPRGVLGRQLKALAGVPLHKRLTDCVLAAGVCPSGIKVSESRVHERIDHRLDLFQVNRAVLSRQSHKTKAKFLDFFFKE